MEEESIVYLSSNACLNFFENNKVNKFCNILPESIVSQMGRSEVECAVKSVSIYNRLEHEILPSFSLQASFILALNRQISSSSITGDTLVENQKIVLNPEVISTQFDLYRELNDKCQNQSELRFQYIAGANEKLRLLLPKKYKFTRSLLIYKKLGDFLLNKQATDRLRDLKVDRLDYYILSLSGWKTNPNDQLTIFFDTSYPIKDFLSMANTKYFAVVCREMKMGIHSSNFGSVVSALAVYTRNYPSKPSFYQESHGYLNEANLRTFRAAIGLDRAPSAKYHHHEHESRPYYHVDFEAPSFFPIDLSNNRISVTLLQQDRSLLNISSEGPPTLIKLLLRSKIMEEPKMNPSASVKKVHLVHVSSRQDLKVFPENSRSSFSVELPPAFRLQAEQKWKISVESLMFSNTFKLPLSKEERTISCQITKEGSSTPLELTIEIPEETSSLYHIVDAINLQNNGKIMAQIDPETKGLYFPKRADETLKFTMNKNLYVFLGTSIDMEMNLEPSSSVTFDGLTVVIVCGPAPYKALEKEQRIVFSRPPLFALFRPKSVWLLSNIIEPIAFGDTLMPVLKMVTLDQLAANSRVNVFQFPQHEYHKTRSSYPNHIHFELRDHKGQLINFNSGFLNEDTQITLKFEEA